MIKTLKVKEIYRTILGESSFSGIPCSLVRLSGCNLRCKWCDTKYAYSGGRFLNFNKIIEKLKKHNCKNILITGGEPLLQENVFPFVDSLIKMRYNVFIETNGSIDTSRLNKKAVIILDIKTPSSGMSGKTNFKNLGKLKSGDEIKFVILNKKDYDWSKEVIRKYKLLKKCTVLISPVFNKLNYNKLAKWILMDNLNVRLNL